MTGNEGAEYGSRGLDDRDFVRRVEACDYPNDRFTHADHLRLAWIYVRDAGPESAEARIVETIRRFARSLDHPEKFHETMTRGWLRLVAVAEAATPGLDDFDEFLAAHVWLLNRQALAPFYSHDLMRSDAARLGFVPPDRRPLPQPPIC